MKPPKKMARRKTSPENVVRALHGVAVAVASAYKLIKPLVKKARAARAARRAKKPKTLD